MGFKITLKEQELFFDKKIKLIDLTNNDKNIICARVNNFTRDLNYEIDKDSKVDFLTLKDHSAMGVYEASIRYLFLMAAHKVYPDLKFKLTYSVNRSIYAQVINKNKLLNVNMVNTIEDKMHELVDKDLPLERIIVEKEKALDLYKKFGYDDKVKVLKYRPEKTVHFYKCDDYYNYMFGRMVPSTGYLQKFDIRVYSPGLLISYPRSEMDGEIPDFKDEPTFSSALNEAQYWGNLVSLDSVSRINYNIKNKEM